MNINRQQTQALSFPRSRRLGGAPDIATSFQPGKFVPIWAAPMFREDSFTGVINVSCEMLETKEILVNPVNLRLRAFVVPWLAMERFEGSREQFDRSYMGEPQYEGGDVVEFFELVAAPAHGTNLIMKALGRHAKAGDMVNTMYDESYNACWNWLAKNRSPDLALRTRLQNTTLAPAFWHHSRYQNVVPDFDQAVIDGQVALNIINPEVAVKGNSVVSGYTADMGRIRAFRGTNPLSLTDFVQSNGTDALRTTTTNSSGGSQDIKPFLDLTQIYAELEQDGITVSLSNIELARKTQHFAKLRERYTGHDDDYIIDMLMSGLSIPEQHLKQPIPLGETVTRFDQVKRYSTDADAMATSATSGGAVASLRVRCPRLSTGGVIMVFAEVLPEQLFERARDPFLYITNNRDGEMLRDLPNALRDTLDPEKVDVVKNADIDVLHASPTDPFGYEPMNARWHRWGPMVGGKFLRPTAGTNTARNRVWPVETANPTLATDFYVASGALPATVFLDEASDPFELAGAMVSVIDGNTQFGGLLVEATDNYDKVAEKAPTERIEKAE